MDSHSLTPLKMRTDCIKLTPITTGNKQLKNTELQTIKPTQDQTVEELPFLIKEFFFVEGKEYATNTNDPTKDFFVSTSICICGTTPYRLTE